MKVYELIDILKGMDGDAEVTINHESEPTIDAYDDEVILWA